MQNTYHIDKDPQLTQNVKYVLPHLWNLMLRIKWNKINLTRRSAFHNNRRLFFHYTEGIFHKSRRNLFHRKKDLAKCKVLFFCLWWPKLLAPSNHAVSGVFQKIFLKIWYPFSNHRSVFLDVDYYNRIKEFFQPHGMFANTKKPTIIPSIMMK